MSVSVIYGHDEGLLTRSATMDTAFSAATFLASGSVLLSGIETSPGRRLVVPIPWDRATELHEDSHGDMCTADTCNMAALTAAMRQRGP